ncbi:MAG: hypothetical protein A3B99_01955 [Candidatus Yanofskybacteria bacterium RIFCSPHIGHO2_02_FULL_44_12b]|nr:MAG: hypothetical protein A3B99_01955 [Candidatus Yanofskybacteria bacterium RIFCSPHIGHO2_02_FULL_44_12b]
MTKQKQLPAPNKSQEALSDGKPSKKELQKYTPEETRKTVLEAFIPDGDLKNNLKTLGDNLLPKLLHGSEKEGKEASEKYTEKVLEIMIALESDTHAGLMETFYSQYRGLAKELSIQIIKDYNATTSAEMALAEVITNAYIRIIDNSRRLNIELGGPGQPINEIRTKYLTMLSKQIDRANRQFLNSLMTLKQLKAPMIEMNIKTNTAFVSQNQQINVPQTNSETNEPT